MATRQIPLRTTPTVYKMTVELDEFSYGLKLMYRERAGYWYLDISFEGQLILASIKLVATEDLLAPYAYLKADNKLPLGTLRVVDTFNLDTDPTQSNIGNQVVLLYDEA